MRRKTKFFIGLTLVIVGMVTNVLYYYGATIGGYGISGLFAVFLIASSSIVMLFFYFGVGGYLLFYNRPRFWEV